MKMLISNFDGSLLSREQMKKVVGGAGNECSSCGESSCGGGCSSGGVQGTCGWTAVPSGHCTCATVGGGVQ